MGAGLACDIRCSCVVNLGIRSTITCDSRLTVATITSPYRSSGINPRFVVTVRAGLAPPGTLSGVDAGASARHRFTHGCRGGAAEMRARGHRTFRGEDFEHVGIDHIGEGAQFIKTEL